MVKISGIYKGNLRCEMTHGPSGQKLITDAPQDNQGKGEYFSPTDLAATSVISCMLTTMAIYAQKHGEELGPCSAEVLKEMVSDPVRRIGKLSIHIFMPKGLPAEKRPVYERVALSCPVHKSLHPDMQVPVQFTYSD